MTQHHYNHLFTQFLPVKGIKYFYICVATHLYQSPNAAPLPSLTFPIFNVAINSQQDLSITVCIWDFGSISDVLP